MKILSTIGRFVYAIPFIVFGIFHFMNAPGMAEMMLAKWPAATFLVYLYGVGLFLAGIAIILNLYARLACILLAALLFIIIIGIQVPGLSAEATRQLSTTMLLKDTALMGAALFMAGTFK